MATKPNGVTLSFARRGSQRPRPADLMREGHIRESSSAILERVSSACGPTLREETSVTTIAFWEPFLPNEGLSLLFHTLVRARERGLRVRVTAYERHYECLDWRRSLGVVEDDKAGAAGEAIDGEDALNLVYYGKREPVDAPNWVAVVEYDPAIPLVLDFADASRGLGIIVGVARVEPIEVPDHLQRVSARHLPFSNAITFASRRCCSVWSTPALAASPGARALRATIDELLDTVEREQRHRENLFRQSILDALESAELTPADDAGEGGCDAVAQGEKVDVGAGATAPPGSSRSSVVATPVDLSAADVLARAERTIGIPIAAAPRPTPGSVAAAVMAAVKTFYDPNTIRADRGGQPARDEARSAESIGEPWVPPYWAGSTTPDPSAVRAWTAAQAGRPVPSLETDSAPLLATMGAPLSPSEAKRAIEMLRPRSREVLARAGIAELTGMSVSDLMSIHGVGPSTVADLVFTWILRDHPRMEVGSLRHQHGRAGDTLCAELGYAGRVRLGEIFHGDPEDVVRLLFLPVVPLEALAQSALLYLSEVVELLIVPRKVRMRTIASIAAARGVFHNLTTLIRDTASRSTSQDVGPDFVDAFPVATDGDARADMRRALVSLLNLASGSAPDLNRAPSIARQPVACWLRQLADSGLTLKSGLTTPTELAQAFKPLPPTLEAAARAKGVARECFKGFFQRPRSAWMLTLARIAVAANRTDLLDLAEAPTLRIVDDQEDADVGT